MVYMKVQIRGQRSEEWGKKKPLDIAYLVVCGLLVQLVKNQPAMWETWVQFLGWEDSQSCGFYSSHVWI